MPGGTTGSSARSRATRTATRDRFEITDHDFVAGSLAVVSYVRPGKLFTASSGLIRAGAGRLTSEAFGRARDAVIDLLQEGG